MFICAAHMHFVITGDATIHTCPVCDEEIKNRKLEKEISGLKDDVKELSRIIDEKGLV